MAVGGLLREGWKGMPWGAPHSLLIGHNKALLQLFGLCSFLHLIVIKYTQHSSLPGPYFSVQLSATKCIYDVV